MLLARQLSQTTVRLFNFLVFWFGNVNTSNVLRLANDVFDAKPISGQTLIRSTKDLVDCRGEAKGKDDEMVDYLVYVRGFRTLYVTSDHRYTWEAERRQIIPVQAFIAGCS